MEAKYVQFDRFGNPQEVLQIGNKRIPDPLPGEVLVRMLMRPINPSDLLPIRGAYSHRISLPAIPGYEGVGIVEEVGSSVSKELLGQRVLPLRGEGTWQQYVTSPAELAVPIPAFITVDTAAQLYINPLTAWVVCTETLSLGEGDSLLINAGGSSIGRILAQLSKVLGYKLIAVTRNDTYVDELLQLGAAHVITASGEHLRQAVMEITNGIGVHAAIDSVGGTAGADLASCVRPHGIVLTLGLLSGNSVNWSEVAQRTKVNVKLFHLRHWNQQISVQRWQETFRRLMALIQDKRLSLRKPHAYYDLSKVREAVCPAESPVNNSGKIMIIG